MSKIANAALAATLALAALPAFAIGTAAYAAPAGVNVADLDLSTAQGAAAFDARVDKAARRFCADRGVTGTRMVSQDCIQAVRAEMAEKAAALRADHRAAGTAVASR